MVGDVWAVGEIYETYVGRWSRRTASQLLAWLGRPSGGRWLDVGCGTGALSQTVVGSTSPSSVIGMDPSLGFLAAAATRLDGTGARLTAGDGRALPFRDECFDTVVSGLSLNFVPDPAAAVAEQFRVAVTGGVVAAYVWDYAEGMEMMRHFWDVAVAVDPAAADLDEARRFAVCRPERLRLLWTEAGFGSVEVQPLDQPTVFTDFDDYWQPFLGGQGPAPSYVASLTDEHRDTLRETLRERLPVGADGSIALTARAWAVRGTR